VRFSENFNFLHFKVKRKNSSGVCEVKFKKANRAKFRLNIEEAVGFIIGP